MARSTLTVGFVIDDLGYGGTQKQLVQLACTLAPRAAVHVYSMSSIVQPHAAVLRAQRIPVTIVARRYRCDMTRWARLARALASDRVDVVHGLLAASNAYAYLAGRTVGKPVVLSMRSQNLSVQGVRERVVREMLRRADAITTNSEAGRTFLQQSVGVDGARVVSVPNIVNVPSTPVRKPHGNPVVGFVGRLAAVKRVDTIVRAFAGVRAQVPSARLEIVGDGPESAPLRILVASLGLDEAVDFVGAVDDATNRIAAMTCVVVASEVEGVPNAALEALSLGVPVVAVPAGDLTALIVDGSTGVIAEPESSSLESAIVRVLHDDSLQSRARIDGPSLVRERFSPQATLAILLPLYERLTKRTGAAAS